MQPGRPPDSPGVCPWWVPAPGREGLEALPERVEVAVVGGGLAGVAVARFLAEGGARVALIEADRVGGGSSGRLPGTAFVGLSEHPFRLRHALGDTRARELLAFSRRGLALLAEAAGEAPTGGLWVAADEREAEHVAASAEALEVLGVPVERWSSSRVAAALGTDTFGPGFFCPDETLVDPFRLVQGQAALAEAAGARLFEGCRVSGLGLGDDGVELLVQGRTLLAEVAVLAAGVDLPAVDPTFEDKVHPAREQCLATAPVAARLPWAVRTQQGYVQWRSMPGGELLLSGCRWATPHMEEGERELVVVDRVQRMIESFLQQRFSELAEAPITHRWPYLVTRTCDGLPIVGPLPGTVRLVACTGFEGHDLGLALAAARGVADGLLRGKHEVPDLVSPGRFV